MHHSKNENCISLLTINHPIRKSRSLATADVTFENWPSSWKAENTFDCRVHFNGEIVTETRLAILIVANGIQEFRLSLGVKGVLHLADRLSAFSNTSLPGIGVTCPERS